MFKREFLDAFAEDVAQRVARELAEHRPPPVGLVRKRALADALGVSGATIDRWTKIGRIPFVQADGGHKRFDVEQVRAALAR